MNKGIKNFIKDWSPTFLVALIIALLIHYFIIFKVKIDSGSMEPTLMTNSHFLVSRYYNFQELNRGDILVFKSKELNSLLVKRLIGLPGDKIKISDGIVTINGVQLSEPYVKNNDFLYKGEFTVPEGKYFFLGDNRNKSNDSRLWINPYIDKDDIQGKILHKMF